MRRVAALSRLMIRSDPSIPGSRTTFLLTDGCQPDAFYFVSLATTALAISSTLGSFLAIGCPKGGKIHGETYFCCSAELVWCRRPDGRLFATSCPEVGLRACYSKCYPELVCENP